MLAICVCAAVPFSAEAERREAPPPAPPPPVPRTVRVARGGKAEIPLRIYGTRSQKLTFIIRAAPQHGKLSEPKQTDPEAATVTYAPPADLAITRDKFSYAVRSNEGVSGAVDINW
jgi:hypothetical protein